MNKMFIQIMWIVGMVLAAILVVPESVKPVTYTGNRIEFLVDNGDTIIVQSDVGFEAASSSYFLFDNRSGSVHGSLVQKPLGWIDDEYWTTGEPTTLSPGEWKVQEGEIITVRFTGENLNVEWRNASAWVMGLMLTVLLLMIWFFGTRLIKRISL